MLYYSRTEVSEDNHVNKASALKECIICHYCFFNKVFRFHPAVCNGWHDILMMSIYINTLAIFNVYGVDYQSTEISKSEAINLF